MIEIKSVYKEKTVELPSYVGSQVTISTKPVMKDFVGIDMKDDISSGVALLVNCIKSWNLSSDGKPLEITVESVLMLPAEDMQFLTEQLELKKK